MAVCLPDESKIPAARKRSVADLLAEFENRRGNKHYPTGRLLFSGVGKKDVYNTTAPFQSAGRTVLAGRVEARDCERSTVIFFEKSNETWCPIGNAPQFELQDPFVTRIGDELVFGGVEYKPALKGSTAGTWKTVFFRGGGIFDLTPFAEGPAGMKDIRLCEYANREIGVFTRPQGEIGGRGTIGYRVISGLDQLCPQAIEDAVLLDDMFVAGEWGGVNEIHFFAGGKLGVLAHVARYEADGTRSYYAATFTFDPITRHYSPLKIIATRDMFAAGPAKRPDLNNVVFSSGLLGGANANVILYAGTSDVAEHWIELPDMFGEIRNIGMSSRAFSSRNGSGYPPRKRDQTKT